VNGNQSPPSHRLDRRAFVGLTGASAAVLLTACNGGSETVSNASGTTQSRCDQLRAAVCPVRTRGRAGRRPGKVVCRTSCGVALRCRSLRIPRHQRRVMRYMPCYCGCKGSGHRNNAMLCPGGPCDGSIVFDSMAPT